MRGDLHVHSSMSDGDLNVRELLDMVAEKGVEAVAVADHNTLAGSCQAEEIASDVNVIFAVEATATAVDGYELHILGYRVNPDNGDLVALLNYIRVLHVIQIERILRNLRIAGYRIDFDDIVRVAGGLDVSLGRRHIAKALLLAGYVSSIQEAYNKLIGHATGVAYVPLDPVSPADVVAKIAKSGGIPVIAHPRAVDLELILALLPYGVRGLELYHPRVTLEARVMLRDVAKRYGLIVTGGSDYHGGEYIPFVKTVHKELL